MGIEAWPAGLNYKPVMDGYTWRPHDQQSRTEMEQGPARKRRQWKDSPAALSLTWIFTRAQLELFRSWHHTTLEDGALYFRMPVWTGASYATCICKFRSTAKPVPAGQAWSLAADIEVRQVPFIDVATNPSIAGLAWPDELEPLPMRDGFGLTLPDVVRTDITPGPVASKRWYEDGPATLDLAWMFTGDDFELFRAWYHLGLSDGVAWFTMPAWVGGWYGTRRCRVIDDYQAVLSKGLWTVTTKLEIREVPYLDDGAAFLLGVLGEESLVAFCDGFHDFLHHTYEA